MISRYVIGTRIDDGNIRLYTGDSDHKAELVEAVRLDFDKRILSERQLKDLKFQIVHHSTIHHLDHVDELVRNMGKI